MTIEENTAWRISLKERREAAGLFQGDLAGAVGISREYFNKIETGKKIPPEKLRRMLDKAMSLRDINGAMEIIFDYVKVRFLSRDLQGMIEGVLKMNMEHFYRDGFGSHGYERLYRSGSITALASDDPTKGCIVEMKGQGCRMFEGILVAQNRSWYDFFGECLAAGCVFKRLDIAINDKVGFLNVPQLIAKCENGECASRFNKWREEKGGEGLRYDSEDGMRIGRSLYIGSEKSELHLCIYEKAMEQLMKKGIPLEEAITQNRVEARLKNDRAMNAVYDLLGRYDVEATVFEIINRYVCFLDAVEGVPPSEWLVNPEWAWFMGEGRGKLHLTTKPEPYTWERSMRWLNNQCAPTLAAAMEIDQKQGTNYVGEMLERAKATQSDKHKAIIEQVTASPEDMVFPAV